MKYEVLKPKLDKDFKRYTGVKRSTFETRLETVQPKYKLGRTPKLTLADQLLMTLMYWREYRTEFHLAQDYSLSESSVCRIIQKVENRLMKSGKYRLPNKKELRSQPKNDLECRIVDVTEQEIERPKKKQRNHYSGKKNATLKKHSSS
jgi:hypothetical protein